MSDVNNLQYIPRDFKSLASTIPPRPQTVEIVGLGVFSHCNHWGTSLHVFSCNFNECHAMTATPRNMGAT
jgi:hypothetical protein